MATAKWKTLTPDEEKEIRGDEEKEIRGWSWHVDGNGHVGLTNPAGRSTRALTIKQAYDALKGAK